MADRKPLSFAEMLRRRKRAIEEGDPTGGEEIDASLERPRSNADAIREALGIRNKKRKK